MKCIYLFHFNYNLSIPNIGGEATLSSFYVLQVKLQVRMPRLFINYLQRHTQTQMSGRCKRSQVVRAATESCTYKYQCTVEKLQCYAKKTPNHSVFLAEADLQPKCPDVKFTVNLVHQVFLFLIYFRGSNAKPDIRKLNSGLCYKAF